MPCQLRSVYTIRFLFSGQSRTVFLFHVSKQEVNGICLRRPLYFSAYVDLTDVSICDGVPLFNTRALTPRPVPGPVRATEMTWTQLLLPGPIGHSGFWVRREGPGVSTTTKWACGGTQAVLSRRGRLRTLQRRAVFRPRVKQGFPCWRSSLPAVSLGGALEGAVTWQVLPRTLQPRILAHCFIRGPTECAQGP